MDINCTKCGEPWDMDYFLHECPEDFDRTDSIIHACPNCAGKDRKGILADLINDEDRNHVITTCEAAAAIGDLLGDDIDGAAALMEDFEQTRND